jgi:hypothetical protein
MTGNSEYDRAMSAWDAAVAQGESLRDEATRSLGGQIVVLKTGSRPVATARFGHQHALLFEQSGATVTAVSPTGQEWHFSSQAAWVAVQADVARAVSDHCAHPQALSLADVLTQVVSVVSQLASHEIGFAHHERRSWVSADHYRVGLAQQAEGVDVKVLVEEVWQHLLVDRAVLAGSFRPWLVQALAAQTQVIAQMNAAREAETKRKQALGQTMFQGVLVALRAGKTFSSGNSRYGNTYYMRDATIHLERFDEGLTQETVLTEAQLLQAVEADPEVFS